jgi:hypothetical protein
MIDALRDRQVAGKPAEGKMFHFFAFRASDNSAPLALSQWEDYANPTDADLTRSWTAAKKPVF